MPNQTLGTFCRLVFWLITNIIFSRTGLDVLANLGEFTLGRSQPIQIASVNVSALMISS